MSEHDERTMSNPQGRVYRSGDDPRIQHPVPDDATRPADDRTARYDAPGYEPDQRGYEPDQRGYEPSQRGYEPGRRGYEPGQQQPEPTQPGPTAAGDGLYRSSFAVEQEVAAMSAPHGAVPDPAATATMPPTGDVPPTPEPEAGGDRGVMRNSAMMAGLNLVSRVLGYGRTVAIGAALGLTVGNAYTQAVYSPQMLYELLMGGTLTSVVVPLLVRARKTDPDRGQAFTERFVTLAATMLLVMSVIVTVGAPVVSWVLARGTPIHDTVTSLSYFMLPAIFFMGLSAMFQAVLNTRGSFAAPTWAPILNNIVIIGFFVMFALIWPDKPTLDTMTLPKIALIGSGFTIAMCVQVVALTPALRKVGYRFRPRFSFRGMGLREIGRLAGWALCYVAISQVGMLVVVKIAGLTTRGDDNTGTIVYDYGFLLMMTINGIAAVSVMTALMPRMSAAAADRRFGDLSDYLSLGTRLSAVLLVPGTVALAVFGSQLGVVLFQYGHFGAAAAHSAGLAIAMAGFGLVPFAVSQLQIFTFYAMPDTRTPALVNVPVVLVKIAFDVAVWFLAPIDYVVPLLLVGNAVSFVVAAIVSYALLRRRIGSLGLRRVASTLLRLVLAGAVAAVPGWLVAKALGPVLGHGRIASLAELAAGGAVLAIVYFGLAYALRVREINQLVSMVRSKVGR